MERVAGVSIWDEDEAARRIRTDPYTRTLYLNRLTRLIGLRNDMTGELNARGKRLVNVCIDATLQDCAWVGASGVALSIVTRGGRE